MFDEPSGAFDDAVANCNKRPEGRYKIELVELPTNADQQRELLVRRLAAEDSDIDIIGMDVIWTAEFAEADWIKRVDRRDRAERHEGCSRARCDRRVQGQALRRPVHVQPQLLWYRKDRVKTAAQDVGRDDRHGRESSASTARSRSRRRATRA